MLNVSFNQIFVSFLPPFAAATPLDFTKWWHKLGRHVYSRQILISGSTIPKFLYIQSRWDMAWLVYKKQAQKLIQSLFVDANFLSSISFTNKITSCLEYIRPIDVKQ